MFSSYNIKTTLVTIFSFNCFATNSISHAQWWNPLEPKDFDECMIKNLKSGMGEEAVKALRYSCMQKYPPNTTVAEKLAEKKTDEKYKRCNLEKNHYQNHIFFGIGRTHNAITSQIVNKLKTLKYDGNMNDVSFQNMNSFGISGVMMGFTSDKQCSQRTEDYRFSTYCKTVSTERGVASNAYGSLSCGQLPKEAKVLRFCPIGFSPIYNQFNESLLEFYETNNYCN